MNYKSITEAANEKTVSRQAVFAAIKAGKLNAIQIGNQHAILVDAAYRDYEPNRNIQAAMRGGK